MARGTLSVLLQICTLAALVLLDARDLWFKWAWLGSDDSYRFTSTSVEKLAGSSSYWSLARSANDSTVDKVISQRVSGWSSFLAPCATVDVFRSKYFHHVRLHDCVVGGNDETTQELLPQLVATSNVRADSMAWAACQLLFVHRRPPVCHENVVVEFLRRHAMQWPSGISIRDMLTPMSDAEAEALNLLAVISTSLPLSSVVCVEGFVLTESRVDRLPTLFGCASPTVNKAAFIGLHATSFAKLHRKMAWLTVHDVNLLGMHYVVRQNARSIYRVLDWEPSINNQTMTLVHESYVNLSSSGVLWHLLLCVDAILLVAHTLSALELAGWAISASRASLKHRTSSESSLPIQFLTISLYRSTPVLLLALLSQLISWILILLSAVIWSWSDSPLSRFHAALSMLRCWVLVLLALRGLWHVVVSVAGEARAYRVLRLTYVAPFEVMAATVMAMVVFRSALSGICERKYSIDRQRLVDASTVDGVAVVSNAYHDEEDYFPIASRASVLSLVYIPLLSIVLLGLLFVSVTATVRALYNRRQLTIQELDSTSTNRQRSSPGAYARLPAEDLLDVAIRSTQLVRSRLALEITASNSSLKALRAEQYLEHGVLLEDGKFLRTRQGFFGVVNPKIHMDDDHAVVGGHGHVDGSCSVGDDATSGDGGGSPTKKRRMSSHIPSLR